MPLTVDTTGVKNHIKVCYVGSKETKDLDYTETTKFLVWTSMAIGIGNITEKNYLVVYFRHVFFQRLIGAKCPITLQDVKNHIGIKINVAFENKTKWKNRITKSIMNSIWYDCLKQEESA